MDNLIYFLDVFVIISEHYLLIKYYMADTSCPECGGMMEEEGNVMRCEDCGYAVPAYGEGDENNGADDME